MEKVKGKIIKHDRMKLAKKARIIYRILLYILLIDISMVILYPFIYMMATSFKSYSDTINIAVKWFPREFTTNNYYIAWNVLDYFRRFINTFMLSSISTVGHIFACSYIAYGIARYKTPVSKVLFAIVILSIVVPIQSIIVPTYLINVKLGIASTYLPIMIPTFLGFGMKGGIFIFLFNQYYIRLPKALEEAAYIDGCGPVKTYFKIAFPSAASVIIVSIVLSFIWHWNDYFEPSIYLNSSKLWILPQVLPQMYSLIENLTLPTDKESMELSKIYHQGVAMAATFMVTSPILILYLFIQRKFVEGIERTGLVE